MGWENIIKRKNAPYGNRTSAEKTQERKRKTAIENHKKNIEILKDKIRNLETNYREKKKYAVHARDRKNTAKDPDKEMQRREKKFFQFENKYKSQIHAAKEKIKEHEAKIKELK